MSILIINSPLYREPGNNYDEVLPPIGLGYLCTNLKENGFNVELFDAVAGKKPLDEIIDYIEHGNFSHVGLNIFSTNHRLVEEIVTRVSKEIIFVIGGAYTKSNYQDITNWDTSNEINVVIGEADTIISDIVSGKIRENPITQKGNKKVYKVDKNSKYFPQDISSLNIDRSFFEYEPTISAKSGKPEGNIVVSRGCVYDCAFCSATVSLNKGNKVRIRTPESVRNEILQIIKLHPNVQSIRILDDLFLRNTKSINEAIQIFTGLNLEWRAMAHIQSFRKVEDNLLIDMKQAGCCELSIGIESGNDEILKSINKVNTTEEVKKTIERIFKAGISVKGYFIIGFPGETEKQFEDTYKLAKYLKELSLSYGVDFRISVFQFRPYHGTQLYYDLVEKGCVIGDIKPTNDIGNKKIGEYDFSNGNFSGTNEKIIKTYIEQIRILNGLPLKFVPYCSVLKDFPQNGIFFVGLSHKLGKDGSVLEAFCNTTNSGKIITDITSIYGLDGIYKTNLVKGVPLDDNRKIRYPDEKEKNVGIDILIREINLFKPRFVFLFGKQVSDFVLKKLNPIKISENEYRYGETIFVLTEHPSYIAVYKRKQIDNYTSGIIEKIKGNI